MERYPGIDQATARRMRVERINYVSEQDEVVDERGTDGVGVTPLALYLDLALASTRRRRPGVGSPI